MDRGAAWTEEQRGQRSSVDRGAAWTEEQRRACGIQAVTRDAAMKATAEAIKVEETLVLQLVVSSNLCLDRVPSRLL